MFQPPNPLMTYNPQQRQQFQPRANNMMPPSPPMQMEQAQQQQNPLMDVMAQRGAQQIGQRMDQTGKNDAAAQAAGANPLNFGQRFGAAFGGNNYGSAGGAADIIRNQQGMGGDMQGPPMPMDMFKNAGGVAAGGGASSFFPSWLTSMFG